MTYISDPNDVATIVARKIARAVMEEFAHAITELTPDYLEEATVHEGESAVLDDWIDTLLNGSGDLVEMEEAVILEFLLELGALDVLSGLGYTIQPPTLS